MKATYADRLRLETAVRDALDIPLPANRTDHIQRYHLMSQRHDAVVLTLDATLADDRASVPELARKLRERTAELPVRYRRFAGTDATERDRQASSIETEGGS
ncbi:MAG: hypothetical protein ACRDQA_03125 [Nocardioidaceae bacterium]